MAKPRVFVSSTYYDLRWIRRSVEEFIHAMGYESVLFESGGVTFDHDKALEDSCYKEIHSCHILILIIGGKYGSPTASDKSVAKDEKVDKAIREYNSITKREYEAAREREIPIYIFIDRGVRAEYETYKNNKELPIKYAHVDNVGIFKLVDDIYDQSQNNLVHEFLNADDITSWLRDQWAGKFAQLISEKKEQKTVKQMGDELKSLTAIVNALKVYSEEVVRATATKDNRDEAERLIFEVDKELSEAKITSIIGSFSTFAHLMEDHHIDAQEIYDVLKESISYDDVAEKLIKQFDCGVLIMEVSEGLARRPIEKIRKVLNLTPWSWRPVIDVDYQEVQDAKH